MRFFIFCLFYLLIAFKINAQELFLPLNNDINAFYSPELNKLNSRFHTSIQPYRISEIEKVVNVDSLMQKELRFKAVPSKSLLYRKLKKENLIQIDSGDFHLAINPLFNFEFGRDLVNDSTPYVNGRGVTMQGSIGKLFFSSTFYENQGTFVNYIDSFIGSNGVIPGQGRIKDFKKGQGYDYAFSTGYISYSPSRYFNFQFGQDKNFIGDGYRSLLLSDNSFNYPFLKITTSIWKIKYVNLFTQYQDIRNAVLHGAGYYFKRKYASTHYLSYDVCKRLSLGVFETVIWADQDTLGRRGFDFSYLNPIIFYRPVEFSNGSPDNVLMGANLKYKINNSNVLYGQFVLDELNIAKIKSDSVGWWAHKYGIQAGLKSFNFLGIKNLYFQTEYNLVRPFTYSEADPIINYAHYNQPLAHPLGSNFKESVSFLRYRYKSFYGVIKFLYAIHGVDTAGQNFGNNLYLPYGTYRNEYGNFIGQGLKKELMFKDFRIGYIVNPKTNLNIEVGISTRSEKDIYSTRQTNFIYIGIRTSLTNFYYDF